MHRQFGADCEVINTKEAKEMHPFLKLDDIQVNMERCLFTSQKYQSNFHAFECAKLIVRHSKQIGHKFVCITRIPILLAC